MRKFLREIRYYNKNISPVAVIAIIAIIGYMLMNLFKNGFRNFGIAGIMSNIAILIFSLVVHELAHGYVAYWCGDRTAKYMGRLSLNPLKHLDPLGTIFPILLILTGSSFVFGWAKPVPINSYIMRQSRLKLFLISIAGVASNFLLALIGIVIYYSFPAIYLGNFSFIVLLLRYLIMLNVILGVFNLIPIPPLDGSRVVASLINIENIFEMDRYGMIIIFVLIWLGYLGKFTFIMSHYLLTYMENTVLLIYNYFHFI